MSKKLIKIYETKEKLSSDAAEFFFSEAKNSIKAHGKFYVAISGGSTPVPLYELLSSDENRHRVDWGLIHFFWADERCVPKDHPDSNFRLAFDLFLSKVPVPESNLHRIRGELGAKEAAADYSKVLGIFFGGSVLPFFDLILLGVGADGHTASIFPGANTSVFFSQPAIPVYVEKLDSYRVSLSLPVLNNADTVIFLATGKEKSFVLQRILEDQNAIYPAATVSARTGRTIWLIDREAASLLTSFEN